MFLLNEYKFKVIKGPISVSGPDVNLFLTRVNPIKIKGFPNKHVKNTLFTSQSKYKVPLLFPA